MARRLIKRSIESLLLESGKVTPADIKTAFDKQASTGKRLEEILVEDNIISEKDLLQVMEIYLGIKYVELEKVSVDQDIAKSVPEALANKYNLIPIGIENGKIIVAMQNPLDLFAIDDVKFATGFDVEPVIASKEAIRKTIDKLFTRQSAEKAVEDLKNEYFISMENEQNSDFTDEINNAPAVRLVNSIISQAVKSRASDIHIEPYETYLKIRFRIDGELHEIMRPAKQIAAAIVTRIKIMSNLNIAEKRIPQDGRIMITVDKNDIDLRVSILPTVFGEKVVIRLLNRSSFLLSKEELGFTENDMAKVENIIRKPYGIVLLTGPTGSGKSTTLYTLLNELNTAEKNIITIEDPVEYMMEGINQVQVNSKIGLTFASGLRSILRQDPDIIMIGEIRDSETAEIALRSAITGHLVLSTLHTNDAPSAVNRLVDMGIQPYMISSALLGVIAQRLVRRICKNCQYEYEPDESEKAILGLNPDQHIRLKKGRGCAVCGYTGYYSRIGIYEIMEITKGHKAAIARNADSDELRNISIENGMRTLAQSCKELVLNGITTTDELLKTTFIME